MTNEKIQMDDPRLTAYALGELERVEAETIRAAIENDAEALAYVEDTRATASVLSFELAKETQPRLELKQREVLLPEPKAKRTWFNAWSYSGMGLVAAAVVAVMLMPAQLDQSLRSHTKTADLSDYEKGVSREAADQVNAAKPAQPYFKAMEQQRQDSRLQKSTAPSSPNAEHSVAGLSLGAANDEYASQAEMAADFAAPSRAKERVAMPASSAPMQKPTPYGNKGYGGGSAGLGLSGGSAGISANQIMAKKAMRIVDPGEGSVPGKVAFDRAIIQPPLEPGSYGDKDGTGTESYPTHVENPFIKSAAEPLSTFSIDVDTASYSNVRRMLNQGMLPPRDAVRIEELVNYFPYNYAPPTDGKPFAVHVEMADTPWTEDHQLVRIALRGKDVAPKDRPKLNLCFLIDVSGSMDEPNKLPLVQESLKLLVDQMHDQDRISLVVYAGASGVVLPPTSGDSRRKIKEAIDNLKAGGSTNGASGIELAYQTLQQNFIKGGVNRVILATDGDFNVGITSENDLVKLIEEKAKGGAFLSVLGFGMGNYKDANLVKLSDKGNGNYAYIDTIAEAKKSLVEQMAGTLITIAKDVKVQVEFNPAYVAAYRLVGYEKRLLANEDFNDDKKDAGEIGSGHTVTAIYEIIPAGKSVPGSVDPLKYGAPAQKAAEEKPAGVKNGEALTVKLRYKEPDGAVSKLIEVPVKNEPKGFAKASGEFQFASAVAAFGMLLKDSEHKGLSSFEAIAATAAKHTEVKGKESEYRKEFVELVRKAGRMKNPMKGE